MHLTLASLDELKIENLVNFHPSLFGIIILFYIFVDNFYYVSAPQLNINSLNVQLNLRFES